MDHYINGVVVIRTKDYWTTDKDKQLAKTIAQVEMNNAKNVAASYLLTHDTIIDENFSSAIKSYLKEQDEVGIWLEINKSWADCAGIKWRGKLGYDWVHSTNVYHLAGYYSEEKVQLIDAVMSSFKEVFGYYPKTVGAWTVDAYSAKYMTDKYGIDAIVICREQFAMDGIMLWGGPYYGGYYPCKNNIMCPASTEEEQINTPVFRMYVNDPIYCYYEHRDQEYNGVPAGAQTQEPTTPNGQSPKWIKWICECLFGEKSFGLSYMQVGHENSFGWERVKKGRTIQHEVLENYANEKYGLEYISIGEMGRRFKEKYKKTPARLVAALDDWMDSGKQSLWFNNSDYRINIFADKENVWIRDIHIFDESYKERYLTEPCDAHGIVYDNLPVMDGVRFAVDAPEKPGFYFGKGYIKDYGKKDDLYYVQIQTADNLITLSLHDKKIVMSAQNDFDIDFQYNCNPYGSRGYIIRVDEKEIEYVLRRKMYTVSLEEGRIDNMVLKTALQDKKMDNMAIKSENGKIAFNLKNNDKCE